MLLDGTDMKYEELINGIKEFEDSYWFAEYIYFKALEHLKDVTTDLSKLETDEHVKEIIKVFLALWGRMGRTVDRKNLGYEKLTEQLRNAEGIFQRIRGKNLLDINLEEREMEETIRQAYDSSRIRYIGATAVSKILHLIDPEVLVMWDGDIRGRYHVAESADGYLKFLKMVKQEVEEALAEEAKRSGRSKEEIVEKICSELPSRKLGQEYNRKTLAKLIDEYEWWSVHH